ncbi:host attachment family protein [Cribrihabitans neustonicus]|uniref:host attachment family protein n=1 Tax=Cribrihabitans neustonicus TaxID=1429085 RepID=UPI003B5A388B
MTKLSKGTWVLVADSEKALFLENVTDAEDPYLEVRSKDEQENPSDREQSANRPGRFNDGPSVHRSAVDDTDWHELAKERFASDLADKLYKMAHKGKFEKLVLVAAPDVLGELRRNLHTEVEDRVAGEIAKNLTNHPLDKIEQMVRDELEAG